jgi:hypothetical protein
MEYKMFDIKIIYEIKQIQGRDGNYTQIRGAHPHPHPSQRVKSELIGFGFGFGCHPIFWVRVWDYSNPHQKPETTPAYT